MFSSSSCQKKRHHQNNELKDNTNHPKKRQKKNKKTALQPRYGVKPFWRPITDNASRWIPATSSSQVTLQRIPEAHKTVYSVKSRKRVIQEKWWFNCKHSVNNVHSVNNNNNHRALGELLYREFVENKDCDSESTDSRCSSDDEEEKEPNCALKARKIRIYPTKEQRKLLQRWIKATRKIYNMTVESVHQTQGNKSYPPTFNVGDQRLIRQKYVNKAGIQAMSSENHWLLEVPQEVRECGFRDVFKAIKAHKAKKQINQTEFRLEVSGTRHIRSTLVVDNGH